MKYIDLHVHSNCSDGTYTPSQLVDHARQKGLAAFALTDHDTIAGLPEAADAARRADVELISGIEFSTEYLGRDVHIVGLDFDFKDQEFQTELFRFQDSRNIRNRKMIQRMQEEGIDITWEAMEERFGAAVWTRAHFARYLTDQGYVPEMKDAFSLYLADDAPCFVPREKVTPVQAVRLIHRFNGIPVLAHPMLYHLSGEELQILITELKQAGLIGIEALYSTYTQEEEDLVRRLAAANGLLISGGSDFHGSNKPDIDLGCGKGNLKIPYEILEELRSAK